MAQFLLQHLRHDKFEYNNKSRKYLTNMQNKEKTTFLPKITQARMLDKQSF